jgi:Zn-finger nucleic acid-binding protein
VQTVKCSACGKDLDVTGMFPGAKVPCGCGAAAVIPGLPRRDATDPATPFRSAESRPVEAAILKCPFCGGPCPSDVRACPHCNVELASVRCPHCFALHFTGSRFCARCGKELELEPLLDATDAPCPRCDRPLSVLGSTSADALPDASLGELGMHECIGCGGMFVSQKTLDAIVKREAPAPEMKNLTGGAANRVPRHSSPSAERLDTVRYVKCPLCHELMNRVNFGKRSGVIVDVCNAHGVWFDKGELTQAIEFVAHGGLASPDGARHGRDAEGPESAELRKEAARMHAALMEESMRDARAVGFAVGRSDGFWSSVRHTTLLDVLFELLR